MTRIRPGIRECICRVLLSGSIGCNACNTKIPIIFERSRNSGSGWKWGTFREVNSEIRTLIFVYAYCRAWVKRSRKKRHIRIGNIALRNNELKIADVGTNEHAISIFTNTYAYNIASKNWLGVPVSKPVVGSTSTVLHLASYFWSRCLTNREIRGLLGVVGAGFVWLAPSLGVHNPYTNESPFKSDAELSNDRGDFYK